MKRRRQNPESAMLQSEADDAIITSGAVMDEVYIEYGELDNDLSVLAKIEAKILAKGDGKELSKEARARRRAIKERMRKLDRLIAAYTNRVIKQAKSRLKDIKASPLAKLHKRNIATVERDIFKLENMVKRKGSDVRLMANSLIGGLVTLEDSMGIKATMGARALSKKDRERENIRKLMLASHDRWGQVKKHARNHDKFFLRGSEVFHKDYGSGIVIDNDGRKVTVKFEGVPYKEMTKAKLTPGPVMWVDAQFHALNNKFEKGRAIEKSDIQRVVAKIVKIHNHTKPRAKLKTYRESKRALEALIGKIETRLSGDKMDKATVDVLLLELEDFHNRVPARMKSEWAKADQRQWAGDITKVRKALTKLKRKANPCIGFHFHGKDAGELLKAVEESNARQRKGVKENPGLFRFDAAEYKKKVRGLSDRQLQNLFEDLAKANWATRKTKKHKEKTIIAYKDAMRRFPESFTARGLAQLKENPTPKRARKYGDVAEAKKSKRDKERGYRFKRDQRTAAKGRRKMNPRPGMTIAKFAHWLGKPEAEADTQKERLQYLEAAAEWEDYGVVTPDEMRDARAIVMAQKAAKRKSNPDDIWSDEITRAQSTALKAWKKQHPEADVEYLRALLKWHGQHYEATPKHATMAASRIGYTLGRSGSGIPNWFPRLGATLHDIAKEERKSGLRDSGRSPNPKGRTKKKAPKKKATKSNPNGNAVTAIVFKVGKKPKKVKSVWSAIEIAATVGGSKREFVPLGGDSGYMVFAKKPLGHENKRNDEATTTAGKKGHRPEIFGTAVLVPPSHRDEAFNASIGRQSRYGESPTERNPSKKKATKKKVAKKRVAKKKTISDKEFWKQIESLNWPKLRKVHLSKGLSWDKQREALLKKKPMSHWKEIGSIAQGKADVVVERLDLGVNDFAWDFSSDIVGHGKRMYDRMISDEAWAKKQLDSEKYGAENFFYIFPRDEGDGADSVSKEELAAEYKLIKKAAKKKAAKKKPAKKKAAKKKATRKAKPEWQKLIDKCRKLWDDYCERPSKKRLKPVLEHLEKMKASTSKKVADERKSCLRIANKEARRLKLK